MKVDRVASSFFLCFGDCLSLIVTIVHDEDTAVELIFSLSRNEANNVATLFAYQMPIRCLIHNQLSSFLLTISTYKFTIIFLKIFEFNQRKAVVL